MAVTQTEVDALRAAAARGVLELRGPDGRMVKYDSLSAMLNAADRLEAQIASVDFNRTTTTSFCRD